MSHHQIKKTSASSSLIASLLATGALFLFVHAPVVAAEADPRAGFAISAGFFDIDNKDFEVAELGIEYRFRPFHLFHGVDLKPVAGAAANEDDAFWLYGGLRYDFAFAKHWVVSPSIAATIYEVGNSKDLGGTFHIRSALEVSYRFTDGQRLGVAFYHVSNAGFGEKNPGANSLELVWTF